MIAVDIDGKITLFNRAAEVITGFYEEDVLGKPIVEVITSTRLPYVLNSGEPELNQKQPMGKTVIITSRLPVKDEAGKVIGAVAVFRDISEIMDLTDEIYKLKEFHSLLEAIFNSTQDAITVCDEKGIHVLVNPAYSRLTGLSQQEIIGKPATADIARGESIHMQVIRTKKPVKNARLKVGPHGKEVVADAAPIIVDGNLRGSVGVLHDLTEIKKLNIEFIGIQEGLELDYDALPEVIQVKIVGRSSVLNQINVKDIKLDVDLKDLNTGTHDVIVNASVPAIAGGEIDELATIPNELSITLTEPKQPE